MDEENSEEYSEIINKLNPSFNNESFTLENSSLLQEFESTKDKTNSIIKDEF